MNTKLRRTTYFIWGCLLVMIILTFSGCTTTPITDEEEYEYQNKVILFKEWAARCRAANNVIFLDNPLKRYPKGIDQHPSPHPIDMAFAQCVTAESIRRAYRGWDRAGY